MAANSTQTLPVLECSLFPENSFLPFLSPPLSFFSLLFSSPFSQPLSPLIPANSTQSIVFDSGTSVTLGGQIQGTQESQSVRNTKAGLRGSGEVAGKPRLGNWKTDEAKERGI